MAPDLNRSIPPADLEKTVRIMENRLKGIGDVFPGAEGHLAKIDLQQQQIMIWLSESPDREDILRFLLRRGKLNFRVDGSIVLDGGDLKSAEAVRQSCDGRPIIEFEFGAAGTKQLEKISTVNTGKKMGTYLDDGLIMEAVLADPIHDGRGVITMGDGIEEAKKIAYLMRTGFLPVSLRIVKVIYGVPSSQID